MTGGNTNHYTTTDVRVFPRYYNVSTQALGRGPCGRSAALKSMRRVAENFGARYRKGVGTGLHAGMIVICTGVRPRYVELDVADQHT